MTLALGAAPGCSPIEVPQCGSDRECPDDGLSCTTPRCGNAGCDVNVLAGRCFIDGACYSDGGINPNDDQQVCRPSQAQRDWTPLSAPDASDTDTTTADTPGDGDTGPDASECVDGDNDSFGPGCAAGPDCDDADDSCSAGCIDIFEDHDGDGYGDPSSAFPVCPGTLPEAGETLLGGDCDDTDRLAHPAAAEIPDDGVDQDCDTVDLTALQALVGVAYVSDSNICSDAGGDSPDTPACSIAQAINSGAQTVFISGGDYAESLLITTPVQLFGGYSPTWERDIASHPTVLEGAPGKASLRIKAPTVIDGLTVRRSESSPLGATVAIAVTEGGALTLTRSTVYLDNGGDSAWAINAVGVSSVLLRGNRVFAGRGPSSGALRVDGADEVWAASNRLYGGMATAVGYVANVTAQKVALVNNTLTGGVVVGAQGCIGARVISPAATIAHNLFGRCVGTFTWQNALELTSGEGTALIINNAINPGPTGSALALDGQARLIGNWIAADGGPLVVGSALEDQDALNDCGFTGCVQAQGNVVSASRLAPLWGWPEMTAPNSPLLQAGVEPSSFGVYVPRDIDGQARSSTPDIGPDERRARYVYQGQGACPGDGLSAETAFCALEDALADAAGQGATVIFVAEGNYKPLNLNVSHEVAVIGGYGPGFSVLKPVVHSTVVSTQGGAVEIFNAPRFALFGLQLRGGLSGGVPTLGAVDTTGSITACSIEGQGAGALAVAGGEVIASGLLLSDGDDALALQSNTRAQVTLGGTLRMFNSVALPPSTPTEGTAAVQASDRGTLTLVHNTLFAGDSIVTAAVRLDGGAYGAFYNNRWVTGAGTTTLYLQAVGGVLSGAYLEHNAFDGPGDCLVRAEDPTTLTPCLTSLLEVDKCEWAGCVGALGSFAPSKSISVEAPTPTPTGLDGTGGTDIRFTLHPRFLRLTTIDAAAQQRPGSDERFAPGAFEP